LDSQKRLCSYFKVVGDVVVSKEELRHLVVKKHLKNLVVDLKKKTLKLKVQLVLKTRNIFCML